MLNKKNKLNMLRKIQYQYYYKDSDDEEVHDRKTLKARHWDDWKDENEKGGGNKMR